MSKKVFIATGAIALLGGLATALAVSSCDEVCTMEAHPSVEVRFFDGTGHQFTEEAATSVTWWKVAGPDGSDRPSDASLRPPVEVEAASCIDEDCTSWIAGWEVEGEIEVRATVCGHEYVERIMVPMDADGCHVETQALDISIDSGDCRGDDLGTPDEDEIGSHCGPTPHHSVLVQTVAKVPGGFIPVAPTSVYGFHRPSGTAGGEAISGLCLDADCTSHAIGSDLAGRFDIKVEACGTVFSESVEVERAEDGCHVATETLTVVIDEETCKKDVPVSADDFAPAPTLCDMKAVPSVFVSTAKQVDDMMISVPVKNVWGVRTKDRVQGNCIDGDAGPNGCSRWVVGYELEGPMTVYTEHCKAEVSRDVRVQMDADGCHVKTEYLTLTPNTIGCMTNEVEPPPPVDPPTINEER